MNTFKVDQNFRATYQNASLCYFGVEIIVELEDILVQEE